MQIKGKYFKRALYVGELANWDSKILAEWDRYIFYFIYMLVIMHLFYRLYRSHFSYDNK